MGLRSPRSIDKKDITPLKKTQCPVCNRPIKFSENFHYGGNVCRACRVFFRRFCRSKIWWELFLILSKYSIASFIRSALQIGQHGCSHSNTDCNYPNCRLCRFFLCLKYEMNPERVQKKEGNMKSMSLYIMTIQYQTHHSKYCISSKNIWCKINYGPWSNIIRKQK